MRCKYCGKEINPKNSYTKEVPYKHRDGSDGVHKYHYCNKHEADLDTAEKDKKKIMRDEIFTVLDRICHGANFALIIKRFNAVKLLDPKNEEKLYYFLHDLNNEIEVTNIMNRSFLSEYAKVGYLTAVLSNKLASFKVDSTSNNTEQTVHKQEVIKEPPHVSIERRKTVSDMEALLNG